MSSPNELNPVSISTLANAENAVAKSMDNFHSFPGMCRREVSEFA